MNEPESIYDRRDVVGTLGTRESRVPSGRLSRDPTLPPVVVVPRALAERALASLRASMTSAGHLAQRVGHEHLGYCGWRSESERCTAQRALIEELRAIVEGV